MCREHTYPAARPDAAVAASTGYPPAGRLAGGRVYSPPRLRSRVEQPARPGLCHPGRGALVGGDWRLHGAGQRYPIRSPRQLESGGRFCHRSKFARPDDGLGRRPRDSNTRGRHPALGLPVVQRRRRYSRCRPHRAGAAGAPPTAGRKRGIEPRPAD